MLKRLLFGNEQAKLNFKTSTRYGVARLYSEESIPLEDEEYWRSYFTLFDSASDVFSLISVSDIRRALALHPENVATLVTLLVRRIDSISHDTDFQRVPQDVGSSSSSSSFVARGSNFTSEVGKNMSGWIPNVSGSPSPASSADTMIGRDRTKELLNCCRLLARLLPIIMEGDHDASCISQADAMASSSGSLSTDNFENKLLWTPTVLDVVSTQMKGSGTSAGNDSETQFVIAEGDEDDEAASGDDPLSKPAESMSLQAEPEKSEQRMGPSLGEQLITNAVNLLFYSGFTLPWTEEQLSLPSDAPVLTSRVQYLIWEKGIGSSEDLPGVTKQHEAHRVEVLRLLLVLLSKSIYVPAHLQSSIDNRALRFLTTEQNRSTVLPLLCSLLNVSLVKSRTDGWLGSLAALPTGLVKDRLGSGTEDVRHNTIMLSLQIFSILVGYDVLTQEQGGLLGTPPTQRPRLRTNESTLSLQSNTTAATDGRRQSTNLFRLYLSKIHRQSDFLSLSDGIFSILSQRLGPASLLGPAATAAVTDTSSAGPHVPEALIILWHLLSHNAKFRAFLLDHTHRAPHLLGHLLYHALNNKDSPARQGLVRLCVFMLHDVSSDRSFAVNICKAGSGAKAKVTGGQRWGLAFGSGATGGTGGAGAGQMQVVTGADILIQSIYSLVATTRSGLSALYAPLIITITNLSPYFRNLSILSANRLVALLTSFGSASFLLAEEGNPRLVYYLLEAINLTIQHGFAKNANLIYALVRSHIVVDQLANFTLLRGIAEVRRVRRKAGVADRTPSHNESDASINSAAKSAPESRGASFEGRQSNGVPVQGAGNDTAAAATAQSGDSTASEKVKGKMRKMSVSETEARAYPKEDDDGEEQLVASLSEEELWTAAESIGRGGFVPTQAWVTSWQKGLPLDTIQLALLELVPKVQDLCSNLAGKSDVDERVLAFLREQSLDNIIAAPGPIQPRPFRWNAQVSIWLLSYLWGLVYLGSSLPLGLFVGSNARLFQVMSQDAGGRSYAGGLGEQLALQNIGSMVFGGLQQVFSLGGQAQATNPSRPV